MKSMKLKKGMALTLAIALVVQMLPGNTILFAKEMGASNSVSALFSSKMENNKENITIETNSSDENIKVMGITLPSGSFVEGNQASYEANENGDYKFEVTYQETVTPEVPTEIVVDETTISTNDETAEDAIETSNEAIAPILGKEKAVVVEGSKVFTHKVASVLDEEALPPVKNEVGTEQEVPKENQGQDGQETLEEIKVPEVDETKKEAEVKATTDIYFTFNPTTQTIIGYSSAIEAPKNVVIPEQIRGVDVLHIGNSAFAGQQLTGITLNSKLQTIGHEAFNNNPNIPEIVFPETITSIGKGAFKGLRKITTVTIPSQVKVIEPYAFDGCSLLASINLPEGLIEIGSSSFSGAGRVKAIVVPSTVETIGIDAFKNVSLLKTINIPTGVKRIEAGVFSNCTALENITLHEEITHIGYSAFAETASIGNVVFPKNLVTIGEKAFYRSAISGTVTIPDSVTTIASDSFYGTSKLTEIKLPTKMSGSIGNVPWGATSATITWKDTVVQDDWMFNIATKTITKYMGASENVTIPSQLVIDGTTYPVEILSNDLFYNNQKIKNAVIQEGIKYIPDRMFDSSKNLVSVSIPESVTSIGNSAFLGCINLENINMPSGLTYIGESAFRNCEALDNITIPGGVEKINRYTFTGTQMSTVILEEGIKTIGQMAFNSSKITTITIPDSVTEIDASGFSQANELKEIYVPTKLSGSISGAPWGSEASVYWSDVIKDDNWVFNTTTNTLSKYIGNDRNVAVTNKMVIAGVEYDVKSLGEGVFSGNKTLSSITFEDNITEIPKNAFEDCSQLTSIVFPKNLIAIGESAFSGCVNLQNVEFPDSLKEIKEKAFYDCKKITEVILPELVKIIGSYAFTNCSNIEKVVFPDNLKEIGVYSFKGVTKLTEIDIPDSVTTIGTGAFSLSGLVEVTIPNLVTDIRYSLFKGCANLEKVTLPNNLETVQSDVFEKTPKLENIYVMSTRDGTGYSVKNNQPWGASSSVKIYYLGEFVNFEHEEKMVEGEYARDIHIQATVDTSNIVQVTNHKGEVISVGGKEWKDVIRVTANGEYKFKALDNNGEYTEYKVKVTNIGMPSIEATDVTVEISNNATLTKDELITLANATTSTETGDTSLPINITNEEFAKVKAMNTVGQSTKINLSTTNPAPWNKTASKEITVKVEADIVAKPVADTTVFTYNGLAQTYTVAPSADYTVSGNVETNGGTYTVTVALNDKTNTKWDDSTTTDVTFSFVIAKATPGMTVTANKIVTRNSGSFGDSFELSAILTGENGEHPEGTVQFKNGAVNVGTPVNVVSGVATTEYSNIPVGNHTITAEFTAVGTPLNYNNITGTASIGIAKRDVVKPVADTTVFTYNGLAQTYTVAPHADYTVSGNVETNRGAYVVTVSLNDKANTQWADGTNTDVTFDFVINGRDIVKPVADTTVFTYNGLAQTYTVAPHADYTVSGNVETNRGAYVVTVSLNDKANTQWADGTNTDVTFDFVINKTVVTDLNLNDLVKAPVKSEKPQSTFENQGQYTGTIKWSDEKMETFAPDTAYTATLDLTATSNYTFNGVIANAFVHSGATNVSNTAGTGSVLVTFARTAEEDKIVVPPVVPPTEPPVAPVVPPTEPPVAPVVPPTEPIVVPPVATIVPPTENIINVQITQETNNNGIDEERAEVYVDKEDDKVQLDGETSIIPSDETPKSGLDAKEGLFSKSFAECTVHWILIALSVLLAAVMLIKRKKNNEDIMYLQGEGEFND